MPERRYPELWHRAAPLLGVRQNAAHTRYCYRFAERLCQLSGARESIVLPAIILHDVGWSTVPEDQILDSFGPRAKFPELRRRHEIEGARIARGILAELDYPADAIAIIAAIIDGHDTRVEIASLEEAVVRDADKLWRFTRFGLETVRDWFGHSTDQQMALLEDWARSRMHTEPGQHMAAGLLAALRAELEQLAGATEARVEPGSPVPREWPIRQILDRLAENGRIVVFAGLPGVGKSLLIQQLARLAHRGGRTVYLLQWDVARRAFETESVMARYPEVDGFTHPALKQVVGHWARRAVLAWHRKHAETKAILIGEAPLVGNRLRELADPASDEVEALLAGEDAHFVVPVPTRAVRMTIEQTRRQTIVAPRHARESADAPPNVLTSLWHEVWREAGRLGLAAGSTPPPYDPDAYRAVFQHYLAARRFTVVEIDRVIETSGSVYELGVPATDLVVEPSAVDGLIERFLEHDPVRSA